MSAVTALNILLTFASANISRGVKKRSTSLIFFLLSLIFLGLTCCGFMSEQS